MSVLFKNFMKGIQNTRLKMKNINYKFSNKINNEKDLENKIGKKKSSFSIFKFDPMSVVMRFKTSVKESCDELFVKINSLKCKLIENNDIGNILEKTSEGVKTIVERFSSANRLIFTKSNLIFKKITFNKAERITISDLLQKFLNYETYSVILNNLKSILLFFIRLTNKLANVFRKLSIIYTKKTIENSNDLNTKIINYTDDFKNNLLKNDYLKNGFFVKWVPPTFFFLRFTLSDAYKITQINRFIKLPRRLQRFYCIQTNFKEYFIRSRTTQKNSALTRFTSEFLYKKSKSKSYFKTWNIFSLMKQGSKRLFLKILLYIGLIFFSYQTIKSLIFRIFNRNSNSELKEALSLIKDMKHQNDQLMKYNIQLIEKVSKKD